jgi:hypothetical protein
MEAETEVTCLGAEEHLGSPEAGGRREQVQPQGLQKKPALLILGFLTSGPLICERKHFCW